MKLDASRGRPTHVQTPNTEAGAASVGKERLAWADFARGISMILVVFHHVQVKHFEYLSSIIGWPVINVWSTVDRALAPMRMPLFFVISGMLAASALRRPWRSVMKRRVANPYYLYVLWLLLSAVGYAIIRSDVDFMLIDSVWELPPMLLVPHSTLWYLYALALYFLVAKLLRPAPIALVLVSAGALSIVASAGWLPTTNLFVIPVLRNLVFFLAGAYLPEAVKRVAAGARPRHLVLAASLYGFVVAVVVLGPRDLLERSGLIVLAGAAGIFLGVLAAALLSRSERISRPVTYIGRNTLPIFLMHVPLIAFFTAVVYGPGGPMWSRLLSQGAVAAAYPLFVAMVVLPTCLVVHRVALRCGGRWLFGLPGIEPGTKATSGGTPRQAVESSGRPSRLTRSLSRAWQRRRRPDRHPVRGRGASRSRDRS